MHTYVVFYLIFMNLMFICLPKDILDRNVEVDRLLSVQYNKYPTVSGIEVFVSRYFMGNLILVNIPLVTQSRCLCTHFCRTCFSMGDLGVQVSVCSSVRPSVNIYPACLVSATPLTVLYRSFWNFACVFVMVWRCTYGLDIIVRLFFVTFST